MDTRARTWVVLGAAIAAYTVAIMHRSSLGVAGVQAAEQFGTTPGTVSTFVVLQLLTYAFAQIPAGTVLDRVGPLAMLVGGSLVMASGQLLLSCTDVLGPAFAARFLVGVGDACIWVSVLTLIPRWFAPRLVPLLSQTAGMLAVVGQLMAVYALLPSIQAFGWQSGLVGAAALGAVIATFHEFRVAMAAQLPVYVGGIVAIHVMRIHLRARMLVDGGRVPRWPEAIVRRWRNRSR